jgi:hypothetical protein
LSEALRDRLVCGVDTQRKLLAVVDLTLKKALGQRNSRALKGGDALQLNALSGQESGNKQLIPKWEYLAEFERSNKAFKDKQKRNYDNRHGVHKLPDIPNNTEVWIQSEAEPVSGTVDTPVSTPRSYAVVTRSGLLRRNRSHLNINPSTDENSETAVHSPKTLSSPNVIMTRSRTGTLSK